MESFWTLTVFTILAQAAAGMAILKGLSPCSCEKRFELWNIVAVVLLGIGTIVSLLHLSRPMFSFYAITNPFSSWLSGEIWSVSILGLCLLVSLIKPHKITRLVSALVAIVMIYVMSQVYATSNVLPWANYLTHASFYTTALVLGSVTLFSLQLLMPCGEDKTAVVNGCLPMTIAFAVFLRIVVVPLQVIRATNAGATVDIMLLDTHVSLLMVGAVVFLVMIMQKALRNANNFAEAKKTCYMSGAVMMLVSVWIAELAGRAMFYDLYVNFGM